MALLAILLWLEEWLWEPLGELMRRIGRLPLIRQLEGLIAHAPPWLALACFAIPLLSLLPFKIAGLWLFGRGHVLSGLGMFFSAKVVGTALGARIFALTRPALMRLAWFARLWAWFVALRERVYARVMANPVWAAVWTATQNMSARLREWWRSLKRRD